MTLKMLLLLLMAGLFMADSNAQNENVAATVNPKAVIVDGFFGFGAEWDSYNYSKNNLSNANFALIQSRIKWMRLPLARIMALAKWCYLGDGKYNFESPEMKWLCRQLDFCQEQGIRVLLTDWGCEPKWLTYSSVKTVDDPIHAEAIGAYMEYLLKTKGYTCIKHFIFGNEPNCEVKDFERWKRGLLNVNAEFKKRGLDKGLILTGADSSECQLTPKGLLWLELSAAQLKNVLGAYDIHRYVGVEELEKGELQAYFSKAWKTARSKDTGTAKPMLVGEAGVFTNGFTASSNPLNMDYSYGVQMADYAAQAANSGASAVSAWMLDDNSHANFSWGAWKSKADGMALKPWFYPWSLLSRLIRPGAQIVSASPAIPKLRILAARMDGREWTFCLVNRAAHSRNVRLKVPQAPKLSLSRYLYSPASAKADANGFPLSMERAEADLAAGFDVPVPGNSVVFLSSLPE